MIFGVLRSFVAAMFRPGRLGEGLNLFVRYFPWSGVERYEFPRRVHVVVCGTREVWRGREEDCPGLLVVVLCGCNRRGARVGAERGGWRDRRLCCGWEWGGAGGRCGAGAESPA